MGGENTDGQRSGKVLDIKDKNINDLGRVHFIGIGGAGMSVLAEILLQKGISVSGSDREKNEKTDRLEQLGAVVFEGQKAENVEGADTVVRSSAIKRDNPEIVKAESLGIRILHRSDILALLLSERKAITVAGAHGKTTVSAMISHILREKGKGSLRDPGYAIGGTLRIGNGKACGGHAGSGEVMVAEADESDGSFLKYSPFLAVVTNIEPDHLDFYGSAEKFEETFAVHMSNASGHIVACADDGGVLSVLKTLKKEQLERTVVYAAGSSGVSGAEDLAVGGIVRIKPVSSAGLESASAGDTSVNEAENAVEKFSLVFPSSAVFGEENRGKVLHVTISVPGMHNIRNATAAICAAVLAGMKPEDAAEAISDFEGVSRRFEKIGSAAGIEVYDDYGHHPSEVAAALEAARRRFPGRTLRVIFQPHLFSRTYYFASEFAKALSIADDVVVTGIYPAREKQRDWPQVNADTIVNAANKLNISNCSICSAETETEAADMIVSRSKKGDAIMTIGAGSVGKIAPYIVSCLSSKTDKS